MIEWVLDGLLIVVLLATAVAALVSHDLFRAVVMFITFGLVMAVCWVRLGVPDVALAEAAIGAGLVGVLLLDAVSHFRRGADGKHPGQHRQDPEPPS